MKKESNHNDEHHRLDSCFLMLLRWCKGKAYGACTFINIPACLEITSYNKIKARQCLPRLLIVALRFYKGFLLEEEDWQITFFVPFASIHAALPFAATPIWYGRSLLSFPFQQLYERRSAYV